MFMNLISKFFIKDNVNNQEIKNEVSGNIAYYNLTDWWLNVLSEDEKNVIREKFKPMGCNENFCIDKGLAKPIFSNMNRYEFLNNLGQWFMYKYDIAEKIYAESQACKPTNYSDSLDVISKHFYYLEQIKFHYANRQQRNHFDLAIEYCKKQIDISKEVKKAWLIKYPEDEYLPKHTGFEQLAIIYEKQKEYKDALDLTRRCLEEGWKNECQKRIDRLKKKIKSS